MHCAGVKDLQVVGTECPCTLPAHRVRILLNRYQCLSRSKPGAANIRLIYHYNVHNKLIKISQNGFHNITL